MDERELQQYFEKFRDGVQLTDEEMRRLARDSSAAAKAMEKMEATFKFLGKQALDVGKKLYEGQQGASVYNDAITKTTDAVGDLLGNFGILGKFLGFFAKAIGGYAAEANKLSDRLYKNYQNLSQMGVSGADGMMGLGEAAQRLGYSLDDAGVADFARLMKVASKDLAALSGSAFEGRKRFTEIADVVKTDVGRGLQNLGLSIPNINEQIAEFVGQQARIGAAQTRSNQDLRKSAIAYVKELDILAKLTGEEKNRLQEQRRAALGEQQFRAKIEELRGKAEFGIIENIQNLQGMITSRAGPELGRGVRDVIAANGAITTEAAAKASQVLGHRLTDIAQRALKGEDYVELYNELARAAGIGTKAFQGVAQFADISDVANLVEGYNLANTYIDREGKIRDRLTNELVKQEAGAEGVTGAATDLRRSQLDTTQSLQTLVTKGVSPLTGAMEGLASVTSKVVRQLGGTVAQPPGGPVTTGAAKTTPAAAGSIQARIIGAEGGAVGARNPYSSASGLGQITKGRYEQLVKEAPMGSALKGTTFGQYQQDAGLQRAALDYQIENLRSWLASKGLSTTDAAVYMAHVFGPAGARSVLTHADSVAVSQLFDKNIIGTNPAIFRGVSTVGDLKRVISDKMGGVGYQFGGIAAGPRSGYAAMLHGTEAVVPLPDGKTIPVSIPGYSDGMGEQLGVMGAQLAALENIVSAMRDQNSISNKILQATNN